MKIDELVGKSLAAAVATIVMGWEYRRCLDVEWWCDTDGFGRHTTDSFRPDLNIAQAWEVLLSLQGWRAHVWQDVDRLWWVRLDHVNSLTGTIPILPDGSLAPPVRPSIESHVDFGVAACRAALSAVEA